MNKDLDYSKFVNPVIQVTWEDYAENFTQDKIKSVKHYFQKKYNTPNVNILTKVKGRETVDKDKVKELIGYVPVSVGLETARLKIKTSGGK